MHAENVRLKTHNASSSLGTASVICPVVMDLTEGTHLELAFKETEAFACSTFWGGADFFPPLVANHALPKAVVRTPSEICSFLMARPKMTL